MKPRIFIGSSTEGLYAAEYIKQYFSPDYDCVIWNEDVFKFNKSFLETLLNSASLFDFRFLAAAVWGIHQHYIKLIVFRIVENVL